MDSTSLGAGPEFDRIRAIVAALGGVTAGVGDDCAFVPWGDTTLALSTDASVEGVHFRRSWLSLHEIGWRAAASALSDLAAVAAEPVGVLAAVVVPPWLDAGGTVDLMRGVGAAASSVGGVVLGGDLSAGEALALTITVVGRCEAPVRRAGAVPGDRLWVTGALGGSRAGLLALQSDDVPAAAARAAFAHPEPRVAVGRWLARHGARAMIDLSDGLAGDAGHLAAASTVRVLVDLGSLPVHPALAERVGRTAESAPELAAIGGEDYELLVAMPAGFDEAGASVCARDTGVPLTRIGEVATGHGVSLLRDGVSVQLAGFDHFA